MSKPNKLFLFVLIFNLIVIPSLNGFYPPSSFGPDAEKVSEHEQRALELANALCHYTHSRAISRFKEKASSSMDDAVIKSALGEDKGGERYQKLSDMLVGKMGQPGLPGIIEEIKSEHLLNNPLQKWYRPQHTIDILAPSAEIKYHCFNVTKMITSTITISLLNTLIERIGKGKSYSHTAETFISSIITTSLITPTITALGLAMLKPAGTRHDGKFTYYNSAWFILPIVIALSNVIGTQFPTIRRLITAIKKKDVLDHMKSTGIRGCTTNALKLAVTLLISLYTAIGVMKDSVTLGEWSINQEAALRELDHLLTKTTRRHSTS